MEDLLSKIILVISAVLFGSIGLFGICKFLLRRLVVDYDAKFNRLFKFKDEGEKFIYETRINLEWIIEFLKKIEIKMEDKK